AAALVALVVAGCALVTHKERARASVEPVELACNSAAEPLGLDDLRPRLAWNLRATGPARGAGSSAYQVLVARGPDALARDAGDLWDSGAVPAENACAVEYAGAPLAARQHAWWKVRVRDRDGRWSAWSAVAHWCTGPLAPADWDARWIGANGASERALHL